MYSAFYSDISMIRKSSFDSFCSESVLKKIYEERVILSSASGLDNIDQKAFLKVAGEQISLVASKMESGKYKFTKYKLKLVSKGRGKIPREISIPTIRDRIALRAICNFLSDKHAHVVESELPQDTVGRVKEAIKESQYDGFVKLDIANFYPTIRHEELLRRIRRRVRDKRVIELVSVAISTPTVVRSRKGEPPNAVGVPQGLSISNILANIYLVNIDIFSKKYPGISYFRFVDDILILCRYDDAKHIASDIIRRFRKIGLAVHDPVKSGQKSKIGRKKDDFEYLGYLFQENIVSVREGSVEKLKSSLVSIFTSYKHSKQRSKEFLLWRLNLRITGCVFQKKTRGWLFYFSQMTNEKILHELDYFVKTLIRRFGVEITAKKFVRSFYQVLYKKYETKYIPNFDLYTIEKKREVLTVYFGYNLKNYTEQQIEYLFRKKIVRQVKDLLIDIQDFS